MINRGVLVSAISRVRFSIICWFAVWGFALCVIAEPPSFRIIGLLFNSHSLVCFLGVEGVSVCLVECFFYLAKF